MRILKNGLYINVGMDVKRGTYESSEKWFVHQQIAKQRYKPSMPQRVSTKNFRYIKRTSTVLQLGTITCCIN